MKQINSLTDEEVVVLVRSKDQELYVHLVNRYQEKLLRYAQYLINDLDLAEDVVQTAFINAYKNLFGFDTKKKFSSWIYRITHNQAINAAKKNNRIINLDQEYWKKVESTQNIEDEYSKEELKNMVRKAVGKLPIGYKSVMTLFFLEERSYEEISDILRMPSGTVGTKINRGKKLLKTIIQEGGGHE
ncbi:RNA polymerase sigma factor [Patescibacteria group bacterium]